MPFTTDGRVHYSGILNEKAVCEFIRTRSTTLRSFLCGATETIEHRGGTHTKADAEIVGGDRCRGVSIKHHKTGTFDWLNSSAEIPASIKEVLSRGLNEIKATYAASAKTPADVATARSRCNDLLGAQLRAMSSDTIRGILSKCFSLYPEYVLITDVAKQEFIVFESKKNMQELACVSPGCTYLLKSSPRAKTSAQIWRRGADGTEVNTHLRLRLVLNNGVNALLGESAANPTSLPCLKIQQDAVAQFIGTLVDPVRESYREPELV